MNQENSFKVSTAQKIAAGLSQYDLQVTVQALPNEEYLQALQNGDFDLCFCEVKLTADWDLRPLLQSYASLNFGGYADPETDQLLAGLCAAEPAGRAAAMTALCKKHGVAHIAIGNGTASRETEQMTVEMLRGLPGVSYMIVNEAGASVYSAGKLAAEEFPDYDVNLRSAISIARRLQDPLAELVKIDPKAIGVGQYQHDMPQKRLDEALCGVVEDCVNAVGVDLNTASASLLGDESGLSGTTAKNLVAYREANGAFPDRKRLLKVPKLGPKAYEQCAGFLRVPESKNVLDNTGVHPESYGAAEKLLALCGCGDEDVRRGAVDGLMRKVQAMGEAKIAEEIGVGVPTLRDVVKELMKPGRDLRSDLPAPILRTDVLDMKDLKPGMVLTGTVRNVIDFGVFVDIGVHQDGLVHISQVCSRFIKHPSEVVAVGDIVKVLVLDVDEKKHRISLSMKQVKE